MVKTVSEATRRKISETMKGRPVSRRALAGSMAERRLRAMGLTRDEAPDLYQKYVEHYLNK